MGNYNGERSLPGQWEEGKKMGNVLPCETHWATTLGNTWGTFMGIENGQRPHCPCIHSPLSFPILMYVPHCRCPLSCTMSNATWAMGLGNEMGSSNGEHGMGKILGQLKKGMIMGNGNEQYEWGDGNDDNGERTWTMRIGGKKMGNELPCETQWATTMGNVHGH
ncbi:hypothetical protein SESBI_00603 [Sesbania bispinosa]|nr:hypothetical protein SESBI_00603 [Sesbania bispinosa]